MTAVFGKRLRRPSTGPIENPVVVADMETARAEIVFKGMIRYPVVYSSAPPERDVLPAEELGLKRSQG